MGIDRVQFKQDLDNIEQATSKRDQHEALSLLVNDIRKLPEDNYKEALDFVRRQNIIDRTSGHHPEFPDLIIEEGSQAKDIVGSLSVKNGNRTDFRSVGPSNDGGVIFQEAEKNQKNPKNPMSLKSSAGSTNPMSQMSSAGSMKSMNESPAGVAGPAPEHDHATGRPPSRP